MCYAAGVSLDAKWIIGTVIGTGLAIVTAVLTAVGLLFGQIAGVNVRIDDLRADFRDLRAEVNVRMDGFDTRLRNVEIAFGKVDRRLLAIERVVLPTPDQPAEQPDHGRLP